MLVGQGNDVHPRQAATEAGERGVRPPRYNKDFSRTPGHKLVTQVHDFPRLSAQHNKKRTGNAGQTSGLEQGAARLAGTDDDTSDLREQSLPQRQRRSIAPLECWLGRDSETIIQLLLRFVRVADWHNVLRSSACQKRLELRPGVRRIQQNRARPATGGKARRYDNHILIR